MRFRSLLISLLPLCFSLSAFGWDDDVHMKMLFAMCRKAAIAPELCLKIALNAGWVDEAFTTTPMFPTFFIGGEVRRRRHFPGNRYFMGESPQHGMAGLGNYMALGYPNSPVGNMLLAEGFHNGDFTLVGAGLHVLMDSFTHNHLAYFGHTDRGHHPDRPWTYLSIDSETGELYNPRFRDMVPVVFQALCAIRDLLPEIGLDKEMRTADGRRSHTLGAGDLAQDFMSFKLYKEISTWKTTWDPRYTRRAMRNLLELAKEDGFLKADYDVNQVLPKDEKHLGATDPYELFLGIVRKLIQSDLGPDGKFGQVLDVAKLRTSTLQGYPLDDIHLVDMSPAEQTRFVNYSTSVFTKGHLPIPLGLYNESAWEVEGANRKLEMDLRHEAWDNFIETVVGPESFEFVTPPSGWRGIPALFCSSTGSWCISNSGKEAISISGTQRIKFNWKMALDLVKYFWRNAPDRTMGYQYPTVWRSQIASGTVQPLLTNRDVVQLIAERLRSLQRQGLKPKADVCSVHLFEAMETAIRLSLP